MQHDYDIGAAFAAIEDELIASMIRNMRWHKAEEVKEDRQWSMWQTEQLKALEKYRVQNQKKYGPRFAKINAKIEGLIRAARDEGEMEQEIAILEAIRKGFPVKRTAKGASAEFFRLNERKLEALIKATAEDMEKAETAILRRADDQYRKAIYNAQVYANTGAGTYEKAVDMATRDMLAAGLTCVQYANGAMHTLADYADMAIRTASKRAYLQGEGAKRREWGLSTVIVNKRGNACPKCLPFCGKILIDDVWSGGPEDGISPMTGKKYPLMSDAIAAGLYHPRCKDVHTTYFEGISTPTDDKYTAAELDQIAEDYRIEQKQQYAERQAEKFGRMARYSLDGENQEKYGRKEKEWKSVAKDSGAGIINPGIAKEVEDVHTVGKINKEIYKCITDDIVTDEVVITDNQIQHMKGRHPEAWEKALNNLKSALQAPDYIIADEKHKNTGLIVKEINSKAEHAQIVLRICTSEDPEGYKNSIISCWKISEKRLRNYLKNKRVLYKKE